MAAIPALDPGKAVVQIATVKIPIDNPCHIWAEKAILPLKPIFINLLKGLKVVFYRPVKQSRNGELDDLLGHPVSVALSLTSFRILIYHSSR